MPSRTGPPRGDGRGWANGTTWYDLAHIDCTRCLKMRPSKTNRTMIRPWRARQPFLCLGDTPRESFAHPVPRPHLHLGIGHVRSVPRWGPYVIDPSSVKEDCVCLTYNFFSSASESISESISDFNNDTQKEGRLPGAGRAGVPRVSRQRRHRRCMGRSCARSRESVNF